MTSGESNMRTLILMLAGLGLCLGAGPAVAQKQSGVFPWERKGAEQIRRSQQDPSKGIFNLDPAALKALGLPSNARPGSKPGAAVVAPEGLGSYRSFDRDRDGSISREEFMASRSRGFRSGRGGDARSRRHRSRLDSQFRGADSNRDGKVSADELQGRRNSRF